MFKFSPSCFALCCLTVCLTFNSHAQWSAVGTTPNTGCTGGQIYALTAFDSVLYAGGSITHCNNALTACRNVAQYSSITSTWTTLSVNPNDGVNGTVYAMVIFNGKLVVGGSFTQCGTGTTCNNVAEWNGTTWSALGTGVNVGVKGGKVYALAVYNGNLIAAGQFTSCNGAATACNNIAQYNSGTNTWSVCGAAHPNDGTESGFAIVALAVYNGNLVAAGGMNDCNGSTTPCNNVCKWNGTNLASSWSVCGAANPNDGINSAGNTITCMEVAGGLLYCGGTYTTCNGNLNTPCNHIATWNGTNANNSWASVGVSPNDGVKGGGGAVYALLASASTGLMVGGNFTSTGSGVACNNIAYWNGTTWSNTFGTAPNEGTSSKIYGMAIYNGLLYAGGTITTCNGATATAVHEIAVYSGLPLPITLNYFNATWSAEDNDVYLDWATASEINNKEFIVEKSPDGIDWQPVVNVPGAGNSTTTLYYNAPDKAPYSGTSYYELKQTDFDGHSSICGTAAVNVPQTLLATVYPNPCPGIAVVQYKAGSSGPVNISLFDLAGRQLSTYSFQPGATGGLNNFNLDLTGLAAGIYLIKVETANASTILKVAKVNW